MSVKLDAAADKVLKVIDKSVAEQKGAYNVRYNGQPLCHGDSEHIKIRRKEDKQGIDVYIDKDARGDRKSVV